MEKLTKKTLLIGSWSPPMMGAPIHLYNLFSRIQPETYLVLTRAKVIAASEGKKENWLDAKYFFCDRPELDRDTFREALKQEETRKSELTPDGPNPKRFQGWRPLFVSAVRSLPFIGSFLANLIVLFHLGWIFARSARAIIRAERAEMMIALSDDGPAMLGILIAHILTRKPFSLFLFDLYKGNALQAGNGFMANLIEPMLARWATSFIVTNERTASYYQARYPNRLRTVVVHNSVVLADYPGPQIPFRMEAPFRIVFTGLAYWPQIQALQNLIHAVSLLGDLPLNLDLYIPSPPPEIVDAVAKAQNVLLTFAPQSEMLRVQSEASILFLPLSWNSHSPDIVATATPSKFTAYLASGRPFLIHAPDYACVSRIARSHDLALVVDRNDVQLLADEIRSLLGDPDRAEAYANRAWKFFLKNFDARENARLLVEAMNIA